MAIRYSEYSPKGDLIWLILRPWIFIPRVLYILLTLFFLFLRILFQGNSKNKNVQKNLSKHLFDVYFLNGIDCISFFTYWDLMVFPGWRANLNVGEKISLNIFKHRNLVRNPVAVERIIERIMI